MPSDFKTDCLNGYQPRLCKSLLALWPDHQAIRVFRKAPHYANQLAASLGIQAIEQRDQLQPLPDRGIGVLDDRHLGIEELFYGYVQDPTEGEQVRDSNRPQIGFRADDRRQRAHRNAGKIRRLAV